MLRHTMAMMVYLAADHAGVGLKDTLIQYLTQQNIPCTDLGPNSTDAVDYPDYAHMLCHAIAGTEDYGVLICGTGIGMSIVANRQTDVRCAVAVNTEMAYFARRHNNANVLALGARLMDAECAQHILGTFLSTPFEGGRHAARLAKIDYIGLQAS